MAPNWEIRILEQQLLELVKSKEPIWKKSNKNYPKDKLWKEIFLELTKQNPGRVASQQDCIKIWGGLCMEWRMFKRRLEAKSGSGKRPCFRHEELMKVFDKPRAKNKMLGNVNENDTIDQVPGSVAQGQNSQMRVQATFTTPSLSMPGTSNKCLGQDEELSQLAKKPRVDTLEEKRLEVCGGKEMDEFQHFCNSLAIRLKKISDVSPRVAHGLLNRLQMEVFNEEMNVLYEK